MKKRYVLNYILCIVILVCSIGVSYADAPIDMRSYSAGTLYHYYTFEKTVRYAYTWTKAVDTVISCSLPETSHPASYQYQFCAGGVYLHTVKTKIPSMEPTTTCQFTTAKTTKKIGLTVYNPYDNGIINMPIQGEYTAYHS